MNIWLVILGALFCTHTFAGAITCGDVLSLEGESRMVLHEAAQKRAQSAIEDFTGKKLTRPYMSLINTVCLKNKCKATGTPKEIAKTIEIFWCETTSTPLHSAYYRLYSSNKDFFDKRYAE